jgi:hypothetical protein
MGKRLGKLNLSITVPVEMRMATHEPVNIRPHLNAELSTSALSKRILCRVAVLALLFAVAGLTTAAKKSWYSPRSNPTHYLSIASKAKVSHAPADLISPQLREPVARIVPPQPVRHVNRWEADEVPPAPRISVVVSMQHRSPPAAIA